jgi:hypothetical protein
MREAFESFDEFNYISCSNFSHDDNPEMNTNNNLSAYIENSDNNSLVSNNLISERPTFNSDNYNAKLNLPLQKNNPPDLRVWGLAISLFAFFIIIVFFLLKIFKRK